MDPRRVLLVTSLAVLGALPSRAANAQEAAADVRPPLASTAGTTEPRTESPDAASVRVQIDSTMTTSLEVLPEGKSTWTTLCRAPCGNRARLDGTYRVTTARGASAVFRLEGASGDTLELSVDPPLRAARVARPLLLATGGVEVGGGLIALLVAGLGSLRACDTDGCGAPGYPPSVTTPVAYAGLISLVAGAVSIVAGANLATTTSVTQRTLLGASPPVDGDPEAQPRAAMWRPPPTEAARVPVSTSAPVLSLAF